MRRYVEPMPAGTTGCLCWDSLVPDDLGECVITRRPDGLYDIDRADPVIAIAGRLLGDWHDGTPPGTSLECSGNASHLGDIVRIEGADRRVVYLVTGWRDYHGADVYTARWPD